MNNTKHLLGLLGVALCGALPGITACAQPSVSVGVEIRTESDFYEPLTPYGRWQVVGSYGRCWIPGRVEADWRPYCEGSWQRTDDGWYWVSAEPWAWATYHYGSWDLSPDFGWYWVPQTQWAPAWVSWHSGGGYIGWSPRYPSGVRVISPRAYVFVEERHFTEPVRRSSLVVNNTTIINRTVIHEAPAATVIEKASGRKLPVVAVRDLRHTEEAPVAARQRTSASAGEKKVPTPIRTAPDTREKQAVAAPAPAPVERPGVAPRAPAPLTPAGRPSEREKAKAAPAPAATRPETAPPAAMKASPAPQAAKFAPPSEHPAVKSEPKAPGQPAPPARQKPAAKDNAAEAQSHNQKAEDHQTPSEKPAGLPRSP